MMEEVSDDTNGESTFEFIENKNSDTAKETSPSVEKKYAESNVTQTASPTSVPPAQSSVLYTESSSLGGQPNIPFYNPANAASYFTPLPTNPLMQPLPPSAAPGPFAETQNWNTYPSSAAPVSQTPMTMLDPTASQCSIALPGSEISPNPMLPEISHDGGGAGGSGVWGWIKGNQLLNKVAEKAKSSVDSVITTLDPGMKEIINSGGDICVIVASENEVKVSAVREAFQLVFGKATVQGVSVQSNSIAPQPVGFSAGLRAAEERISNLRQQGHLDGNHVALAVENFIAELTPDNWFDIGCLLLQDSNSGISLQVYTQATPVSSLYVAQAKDQTPPDYPLGWSGHAVTVGQIISSSLGVHHSEWHQALTGVSRREMLFLAARSIAGLYKGQLRR